MTRPDKQRTELLLSSDNYPLDTSCVQFYRPLLRAPERHLSRPVDIDSRATNHNLSLQPISSHYPPFLAWLAATVVLPVGDRGRDGPESRALPCHSCVTAD